MEAGRGTTRYVPALAYCRRYDPYMDVWLGL